MAAAVAEARRVLRPAGLLIDIHPQATPMQLEAWYALDARAAARPGPGDASLFERRPLGSLDADPTLDDFEAASRALAPESAAGFSPAATAEFDYFFFFENLDELTDYLEEYDHPELANDALLERALAALSETPAPPWLVLVQPVGVTALTKTGDP